MTTNWQSLSPDERMEQRFNEWLSPPGVQFATPEAEVAYKQRVTRLKDAIQLKKAPDRVPVFPFTGFYPAFYAGRTPHDMMYDYDKLVDAWNKYVFDFEPDAYLGAFLLGSGPMFEILDYKIYNWPGHGVSIDSPYQALEAEYMKAEDYDILIDDPTDFWLRTYLPRVAGAFESLSMLPAFRDIVELPFMGPSIIPFGLPPVQDALQKMMKAGEEGLRWAEALGRSDATLMGGGFPNGAGSFAKAPFDILGDTLRGTRAIMMDIYRQPEKLLLAMERIVPLMIRMGVGTATVNHNPIVFIPLHKGADGFMSDQQFHKFYWPTLRKVILGLIDEGTVPFLFAEGGYNSRLEAICDLPKGKTIWMFDYTDMARAKETIGKVACLMGNVPVATLQTGTVEATVEACRQLFETAAKGGGFILSNGAVLDEAKPENLRAMMQYAKEHGSYS
jgi:hypothetical protein